MVNERAFDELSDRNHASPSHDSSSRWQHDDDRWSASSSRCVWNDDDCGGLRADSRHARLIARQLRYEVTQLEGRQQPIVRIEVVRPGLASFAVANDRPGYAPRSLADAAPAEETAPPPASVLHLDQVVSVTNLGTWIDILA